MKMLAMKKEEHLKDQIMLLILYVIVGTVPVALLLSLLFRDFSKSSEVDVTAFFCPSPLLIVWIPAWRLYRVIARDTRRR